VLVFSVSVIRDLIRRIELQFLYYRGERKSEKCKEISAVIKPAAN